MGNGEELTVWSRLRFAQPRSTYTIFHAIGTDISVHYALQMRSNQPTEVVRVIHTRIHPLASLRGMSVACVTSDENSIILRVSGGNALSDYHPLVQ